MPLIEFYGNREQWFGFRNTSRPNSELLLQLCKDDNPADEFGVKQAQSQ